jgi:hypothetical protein
MDQNEISPLPSYAWNCLDVNGLWSAIPDGDQDTAFHFLFELLFVGSVCPGIVPWYDRCGDTCAIEEVDRLLLFSSLTRTSRKSYTAKISDFLSSLRDLRGSKT